MRYRKLGGSGLNVSVIGLGSWLTYGTATEAETAEACIRRAYELGVNFFDTANAYNRGAAEEVMGRVLAEYPRESCVIATKVYFPMGEGPNDRGLSRKHIMEQCEASLRRLGTDYIDLYQCHRHDPETPPEETLRALDDLQAQGKILYAGVSEWSAAQIADAVGIADRLGLRKLVSNQPIYNMLVRYIEKEVVPVSLREGIGQVVFSPLAQGILTGKYKPGSPIPAKSRASDERTNLWIKSYLRDDVLACVEKLAALAEETGCTPTQFALAWVLGRPGISSAIVGASRTAQVEENAAAADLNLPEDVLKKADAILDELHGFVPIW